jgi:hypothetical protein
MVDTARSSTHSMQSLQKSLLYDIVTELLLVSFAGAWPVLHTSSAATLLHGVCQGVGLRMQLQCTQCKFVSIG